MSNDLRTRRLSETCAERGPNRPLFTKGGPPNYVENGGLASYGSNYHESGRMAARLVDEIIKGVKPSEIPVEVNHKIEFVVNLKVAKALGIKIAPEALYRANRVLR